MHEHHHDHDHAHHKPQSFEASLEVASEAEKAVVVHGWLYVDGKWILHAWTEVDNAVYDLTESRAPQEREAWYAHHGVTEERLRRYGRVEFFTRFAETASFGPYDTQLFFAGESTVDPLERMKKE